LQGKTFKMYAWRKKAPTNSETNKTFTDRSTFTGANRRAIGLIPVPLDEAADKIPLPGSLRYRELLVSIEGKQSTCCLRIISPRRRSRSAVLIFRGRVMGCIYGAKNLGRQLMGEEAHMRAMSDMALPDNTLDAHNLDEEIVLAAASLFHGSVLQPPDEIQEIYEWCIEAAIASDLPACVVVNDSAHVPVCMVYLVKGKIVGVYSFKDGWVSSAYEAGLKYVLETPGVNISASVLDSRSEEELAGLTFSLTGLADRDDQKWSGGHSTIQLDSADIQGEAQRTTWQLQQMQKNPNQKMTREIDPPGGRPFDFRGNHSHSIKP
jgi:hypothetical protein